MESKPTLKLLPLVVHSIHLGRDIDQLREAISQHVIDVDITLCADNKFGIDGYLASTGDNDLQIAYIQYGLNSMVQCQQDDVFCLVIPFDGDHRIRHNKINQTLNDSVFLLPPLASLEMRYSADCGHLVLRFKNTCFHKEAFDSIVSNNFILTEAQQREIQVLALEFTRTCFLVAKHVQTHEVIQKFKNELYDVLNRSNTSSFLPPAPNSQGVVNDIIKYFHDHPDWEYDLDQLTALFEIPVRTLYWNFKRHVGLTPYRTYLNIKLSRTRLDILKYGNRLSITQIASRHGFIHLGRFSSQYKQLFGELPRQTMQNTSIRKCNADFLL